MSQPASEETIAWHTRSVDAAVSELSSARVGLAKADAAQRLEQHGPNELRASAHISAWKIFFDQLKD